MRRKGTWLAAVFGAAYALVGTTALAAPVPHISLGRGGVAASRRFWTARRMERADAATAAAPGSSESAEATSEVIADPTAEGMRENGAIFISEGPEGGFARCSGTAVTAGRESLVFTAGHCVIENGRWSSRHWVFVPAYRYGERPFGTFVAKWLGTTPGWRKEENFNYDVGVAVVSRNERGQTLAAA